MKKGRGHCLVSGWPWVPCVTRDSDVQSKIVAVLPGTSAATVQERGFVPSALEMGRDGEGFLATGSARPLASVSSRMRAREGAASLGHIRDIVGEEFWIQERRQWVLCCVPTATSQARDTARLSLRSFRRSDLLAHREGRQTRPVAPSWMVPSLCSAQLVSSHQAECFISLGLEPGGSLGELWELVLGCQG